MINCTCECHKFHILECSECLDVHHYDEYEGISLFSDSYIVEMISEYFHRYGIVRLGDYYYDIIFTGMVCNRIITLEASKLHYISYLFKNKRQTKILPLIHRGIISFMMKNGKCDIARECNELGKIKWIIQ